MDMDASGSETEPPAMFLAFVRCADLMNSRDAVLLITLIDCCH